MTAAANSSDTDSLGVGSVDSLEGILSPIELVNKIANPKIASTMTKQKRALILDGNNLSISDLVDCSKDLCKIEVIER